MCERMDFSDGTFAIVCGSRRTRKKCKWCGAPATKLCDHVTSSPAQIMHRKMCDAPMCDRHAKSIGPEKDLCPFHARAKVMTQSAHDEASAITWPASRKDLYAAGYVRDFTIPPRPCKRCGKRIEFWRTPQANLMPLEESETAANVMLCHFATCPHAEEFRKSKIETTPTQRELFR